MTPTQPSAPQLTAGPRLPTSGEPPRPPVRPLPPERKKPRKRRGGTALGRIFGLFLIVVLAGVGVAGVAGFVLYQKYSADLPSIEGVRNYQPRVMSRVYAGDSRLLAELATERRIFVPSSAIPELVKRAFISAEDQNFMTHAGVDPLAMARAAVTDILQHGSGKRPVGASTITQQVAKNMLTGNQLSLARKVREALLALRIERNLSKDRILELYLNEIYLGEGAYGVAAAAQTYFDASLDQLTPAQAAFLAALPKAPNNYNPSKYPEAARNRRDWVLDRMVDTGSITAEQAAAGKATPIQQVAAKRPDIVTGADYFAEEVRRTLVDRYGADQTTQGGLVVRTSLDPALQLLAGKTLRDGLVRYDQHNSGWRGPVAKTPGGPALKTGWADVLRGVKPPPGMPPEWQLAIVTEIAGGDARMGLYDHESGIPRIMPMTLADMQWARPVRGSGYGPSPRRVEDVLTAGDVVMVQVAAPVTLAADKPGKPVKIPTARVQLRQIPQVQGALVSMDPATGRVLAMSGGWSFEQSQFNRATQAQRQPGSSFKPLVYLTAMEQGISPSQRFLDAPFVLDVPGQPQWRPSNYELDFNGAVPLHTALEKSLNLVTIRVAQKVGMDAVATNAVAFHEVDQMPLVLPAALGAIETTVLRQAGTYSGFASGGREVVPTLIDTVQDRDGRLIWSAPGIQCQGCDDPTHPPSLVDRRREIADPASVFQVVMMMEGVVQHGTGFAAGKGLDRQVAGKTGTTQDFADAWFVGFTPDLVTAVWIGFDDPSSLGKDETGGAIAAPIWHDFMAEALRGRPALKFAPPPGVTVATYDVIGVWDGQFFRLHDHLRRFRASMNGLRLRPPESDAEIEALLHHCVALSGLRRAYVAVDCLRGRPPPGMPYHPAFARNYLAAFAMPWVSLVSPEMMTRGAHLIIAETLRIPSRSVDPRYKNFHWADLTSGQFEAHDRGADFCVLLDAEGCVTEGAGFNVFVVSNGVVATPDAGMLEGITRQSVIELCAELGIPMEVRAMPAASLREADEIFLATTAGGIMPASRIDGRIMGNDRPGPISRLIHDHFWARRAQGWHATDVDYASARRVAEPG